MKRPGHPVEMATVYVLLASQEASYITDEDTASWEGLKYRSACVNEDVRTSTSNVPQYPH